jgi:hypothetical protein
MEHDIHVLRGQSTRDLTHAGLRFRRDTNPANDLSADDYLNQFGDVTLTFTPLFSGNQSAGSFVGNNNGLTVNTSTGVVTVASGMPANRKNNFIIEVVATNTTDGSHFNDTIRVQVHGAMSQVWLTPDQLTVRMFGSPGTQVHTAYRFAVRALFDDNVMGDLTDGHGVTWTETGGHVGADGTISILPGDSPDTNFFVSATLPAEFGGAITPNGPTLHIGPTWSNDPTPPQFNIVAGGGVPVTGTAETNANVLFIGDGFTSADGDTFDQIVDTYVHFLQSNTLTKPFNLFSSRMNFWKILFPAGQMGISFRSELATLGIKPYAVPVPAVKKPAPDPPAPAPPTQWDLPNLLYAVGLPIPGDEAAARSPALLKQEWQRLLQNDPVPHIGADPNDDLVNSWKMLARRVLVEEQDDFPGLAYGYIPTANADDTTLLHLHEDRAGLRLLRADLATLGSDDATTSDSRPIGALWAGDEAGFRFLNRDLVAVISSCPGGRAANQRSQTLGHYVAVTSGPMNPYIPLTQPTGQSTFELDFPGASADVEASASRIVAHELGHSMGLGDEYPEFTGPFPKQSADPGQANLQTEHDARDSATNSLSGNQILWTWHRITAAAVVDQGTISDAGPNRFQIPLIPDVSFRFAQGDTVLLRKRAWKSVLQRLQPGDVSPALVIADPPQSGAVVVSPGPAAAVTLADLQAFAPGSLLYTPKPAPASVLSAAYPYAEMVAKNVKDAITTNKMPLTEVPCVFDTSNPQIPLVDVEGGRTAVADFQMDFADIARVVGLYSGGSRYSCGIFHPTGQCMMRNDLDAQAEFCAVCRYIMVDLMAPDFHSDIDADYDPIYPQK